MDIGIPSEARRQECRVALTPPGVRTLCEAGHAIFVEEGAGLASGFANDDYQRVGATIVYDADDVLDRSELLLRVAPPIREECERLRVGAILMGFLILPTARREVLELLRRHEVTAVGYELIEEDDGTRPILVSMSEIAGQQVVGIAEHFLQNRQGGRGIMLGGAPGVTPATVVILGAGTVGSSAARALSALGAQVVVLDRDVKKLRRLREELGSAVMTSVATPFHIERAVRFADVLLGAVLVHGEPTPHLVTREMVRTMKPRSLIIDLSIDQGGCVETSRPTTLADPVYEEEGVLHYCVPNIPSNVSRTATRALTNISLPFVQAVAGRGIEGALAGAPELRRGAYLFRGRAVSPPVAEAMGCSVKDLGELLRDRGGSSGSAPPREAPGGEGSS